MTTLYVDADACPVKEEVARVSQRTGVKAILVSNGGIRRPNEGDVEVVVVDGGFDAADDWIAERAGPGDVAVTADIQLAKRCLDRGAQVLGPDGRTFTPNNIGPALAQRALMQDLRDMGVAQGGPPPFRKEDRSRFLQALDTAVAAARRGR